MGKNVAVFVDVANIFYAAKAAGVDIDYVTLLKASSAGRDLVRAYAYTGLDPDNENQRNFHDFLRRHGYKVVSKDIRKYGDGKVKANLDIELVVDMMKTARNLDVAIVVSGDGDFAPAIRAVQEMGIRVEVVSFRGNTSSDLMDVADQFTDITQIAKVEKGSSRSGRRVAGDDADLSMTEVPDKQSEGTGERGRGRGRARRTSEPVGVTSRGRSRVAVSGEPALLVLPGEKLSRAAAAASSDAGEGAAARAEDAEAELAIAEGAEPEGGDTDLAAGDDATRRRRRRRGGRGRGRGRGRDEGYGEDAEPGEGRAPDAEEPDEELVAAPARPRPTSSFGSVWDSQIGIPAARSTASQLGAPEDDEDLEEPAIPEYLLAERRRQGSRQGRGGRGRGGAYAAALDRERFGGGRGSTISRFAEPPRREPSGPRREPSGPRREPSGPRREPAPTRGGRPERRAGGDEPWSEVPPEIEAMLRAQLGASSAGPSRSRPEPQPAPAEAAAPAEATTAEGEPDAKPTTRRRTTRTTRAADASAVPAPAEGEPDAKPTTRRRTTRTSKTESADAVIVAASEAKPKRTTRSRTTAASGAAEAAEAAEAAAVATEAGSATSDAPAAAPTRRRTTRKKAEPTA